MGFLVVYLFFALFYIPKSSSFIVYNSRSLLNVGDKVAYVILDTFKPDPSRPTEMLGGAETMAAHSRRKTRRVKRAGVRSFFDTFQCVLYFYNYACDKTKNLESYCSHMLSCYVTCRAKVDGTCFHWMREVVSLCSEEKKE